MVTSFSIRPALVSPEPVSCVSIDPSTLSLIVILPPPQPQSPYNHFTPLMYTLHLAPCPLPPAPYFRPHLLDIVQGDPRRWWPASNPRITPRFCAVAPGDTSANDEYETKAEVAMLCRNNTLQQTDNLLLFRQCTFLIMCAEAFYSFLSFDLAILWRLC